jgi:predicted nucleotidyltransferase
VYAVDVLNEVQKKHIAQYLKQRFLAYTVILFGSAARESLRPDSDIDIAMLTARTYTPYELFLAAGELADYLNREVDLIDFVQSSPVFRSQIIGNYELLLDDNPMERQYAFMRALKEYVKLNEERSAILTKEIDYWGERENTFD